jgi:hypothetical protein
MLGHWSHLAEINMKKIASIPAFLLFAISMLCLGYWTPVAHASTIRYVFQGFGAFGDIDGNTFDDVNFEISIFGNTANVDTTTDPATATLSNLRGTIRISGSGVNVVGRFNDPLNMFVNHTDQAVGFGNGPLLEGDLTDLFAPMTTLDTYDLKSLFGPIWAGMWIKDSTMFSTQFGGVPLDIGIITFDDMGENISFAALPKPIAIADFDGDSRTDLAIWHPASGTWYVQPSSSPEVTTSTSWGLSTDRPTLGDYDGDGRSDIAVWHPATGTWYILPSNSPGSYTSTQWGVPTDVPAQGDYDGDGITDIAVYRPSSGVWYLLSSASPGSYTARQWGVSTDLPVPGDYDGDGKTDIAVFNPTSGTWYVLPSASPGTYTARQWGLSTDLPVQGDYDGDGKTDIAVYRPGTGNWYVLPSGSLGSYTTTQLGATGDIPAPGDYDGDGKTDLAVWRPSTGQWFVIPSTEGLNFYEVSFGSSADSPIVAY